MVCRARIHSISSQCMQLEKGESCVGRRGKPLLLSTGLAPLLTVSRAEAILPYNLPQLPVSESLRKIVTGVVGAGRDSGRPPLPGKTGFLRHVLPLNVRNPCDCTGKVKRYAMARGSQYGWNIKRAWFRDTAPENRANHANGQSLAVLWDHSSNALIQSPRTCIP